MDLHPITQNQNVQNSNILQYVNKGLQILGKLYFFNNFLRV